ncbi:bifunctional nitrate reductase/sulfite reductase flavoprotein subunit alpha [Nocardia stercoris]|uniref:assimilatory sulfite reductase (NADPH) n=1 Tax=Nocardia stercoris TaxID=2483361 RepID=A0A3M2L0J6_9NOCA|nr:bifunctional nitrate reductase/sulfite reductase flavoprotein subunit alpha [Nocardia stercoris]RMI30904.1 molybdopterin oxidoreductase [Nocardia stercoris]
MPDAPAPRQTSATCSYCGVGCGIRVRTTTGAGGSPVIAAVRGDKLHPVNGGRLCTKGATHTELMRAPGRMTTAYRREHRDQQPEPFHIDAAIRETAGRLRAIAETHGPDAVAIYVSGQMSLEAQYLATKLAKGHLRTIHLESNSRLCMAGASTGYKQSLGADGPPGSYDDLDHADLFFVSGANMADCHPILFLRMVDRLKAGARLIVVDPRRTETAARADLFLQIAPGTDLALLNGLLHLLVDNGDIDKDFIAEHTQGWEAMEEFLADYPPARVAAVTGLAEADIRTAAQWIGEAGEWMSLWTMGLNQSTHGTWNTNALCNLHLATGAICRTGSGPFSLTGQPNAMGGREMGYMGAGLPGQRSTLSAADRRFVETRWGIAEGTIRAEAGSGTIEMFRKLAAGTVKAAWIIGSNPVASVPNRKTVIAGLEAAELVVVQDVYPDTATTAYADLLLPATLWTESDVVTVNSERTVSLSQRAVDPVGDARPDWLLIAQIATAMGYPGFEFTSSEQVFEEIRDFANPATGYDLTGMSYAALREGPMQWPCADPARRRNPIRYRNDGTVTPQYTAADGTVPALAFPTESRRAVFWPRPHLPPAELPDDDYPFLLNTGRLPHQWHTMTRTGRVDKLTKLTGEPFVQVHPADAQRLEIQPGDQLELTSRRGRAVLPVLISDRVRPGECFAPFHWNDEQGEYVTVNAVTNDAVDADSLQPEFKACAVALRKVAPMVTVPEAPPIPVATPAEHPLAAMLGLETPAAPTLSESERIYLGGYLAALQTLPVRGQPVLPETAPMAPRTRLWVDGLLAGMYSRGTAQSAGTESAAAEAATPITVLWASQTGTAEEFAASVAGRLTESGYAPRLLDMNSCELSDLTGDALVITSTFGDGGPPDNGADFWERLYDSANRFDDLRYAVFALGDSSYDDFCAHGRKVDETLAKRGATRLLARVDSEPDHDELSQRWLADVLSALANTTVPTEDSRIAPTAPTATRPVETAARSLGRIRTAPPSFTRNSPVLAPLVRNSLLSKPGSGKEVRQFGFDLSGLEAGYEAGDSLGIWPTNSEALVAEWLSVTGLDGSRAVELDEREVSLAEALRTHYDISKVGTDLLNFVAAHNSSARLAKLLRRDNRNELDGYLWDRQAVDVLRDFPVRTGLVDWLGTLKKLQPRQYSISSSPLVSPAEVQLTVAVVRYGEAAARRGGVCSTYLADRARDTAVPVFLQRAPHFRPPLDPGAPMIMIGPGTGIAPFRGFLQERQARGCRGRNWLFFGDQHADEHFYYRDELEGMFRSGFLTRLDLAFSRDQRERVYVQHRMIQHGAELWSWLAEGAHLYVCGDAARMARDVDDTLLTIARIHGKLDADGALAFKKRLVAEKRYVRDVY